MAGKRGPESFIKRQRELQKQRERLAKQERRRARSAQKKEAKLNEGLGPSPGDEANPPGPGGEAE